MKFIRFKKHWSTEFFGIDTQETFFEHDFSYELLNAELIKHVYIVMDSKTDICVEYEQFGSGELYSLHESFANESECLARFNEIEKLLKEEN